MGAASTVKPDSTITTLKKQLTDLQKRYKDAQVIEGAAKLAYSSQMRLLAPSNIVSLKVASGDVSFYTLVTPSGNAPIIGLKTTDKDYPKIPYVGFVNANLTKYHWVTGLSNQKQKYSFSGLFEGDINFMSGAGLRQELKLYQDNRDNLSAVDVNGVIWSTKTGVTRPDLTTDIWNKYLKAIDPKTKLTYKQMITAQGIQTGKQTVTVETAPLSIKNGGGIANYKDEDEVYWANHLYRYFVTCTNYTKTLAQLVSDKRKELKGEETVLGVKDTTGVKDTKPKVIDNLGSQGVGDDTQPVIYNLPAPKSSYFRAGDFASEFIVSDRTYVSADAPVRVDEGKGLWNGQHILNKKKHIDRYNDLYTGAHKGMIQSYVVPGNFNGQSKFWNPNDKTAGFKGGLKTINKRRYAFQFLYNPSTISMHYAGAPQVDIGLETSGADKVALIGSGVTSSTVTFNLLLNRMNDMRYIEDLTKNGKDWRDIYSHNANHPEINSSKASVEIPSVMDEIKAIQNKGTMYDLEYLLRTLIGYQLPSQLRGGAFTSDIGYLGAYPVELHLGKDMRYLVTIDSFDVTHTIFTKDMVPVFTNLSLTCNRLPEYNKNLNEITTRETTTNANDKGNQ